MPTYKKIWIIAHPKFMNSPRKLKEKLKEHFPKKKIFVRSSEKPMPPAHVHHLFLYWNNKLKQNKLAQYRAFKQADLPHPEWTTNREVAKQWLDKQSIMARNLLASFGGKGIKYIERRDWEAFDTPQNPITKIYTKYKKKKTEYRVHIFNQTIIDVSEKRRERLEEGQERNNKIRNRKNGWVYCRENIKVTEEMKELALTAIRTLGYLFGAVDIIYNEKENKYYVLEVNTAPGLEGTTLQKYAEELKNIILRKEKDYVG